MPEIPSKVKEIIGDRTPEEAAILVSYKNYRGEISNRKIIPLRIFFGKTEYHPQEQYLLEVWDLDKEDFRTYSLADIESWIKFPQ